MDENGSGRGTAGSGTMETTRGDNGEGTGDPPSTMHLGTKQHPAPLLAGWKGGATSMREVTEMAISQDIPPSKASLIYFCHIEKTS